MLGSTDRENSRGTVGNSIHIDTWFYTALKQPSAPQIKCALDEAYLCQLTCGIIMSSSV